MNKDKFVCYNFVAEGVAFPQEEPLNAETGAKFFSSQSYCGVAVNEDSSVVGLYILLLLLWACTFFTLTMSDAAGISATRATPFHHPAADSISAKSLSLTVFKRKKQH